MKNEREIDRTIEKLNKYFAYAEKRLAIHEASHVVFSYLMGYSCKYMQTGLKRDVSYQNNNIVIDAESISKIYNIFPSILDNALLLITMGHPIQNISISTGVNSELIKSEIKKYIVVLLSGCEAENHFYNGIKYWFIKRIPVKYSVDLTPSDFGNDKTKIDFLSQKIRLSNYQIKCLKKMIRSTLNDKDIKTTCFTLTKKCLEKTRLTQQEIETILLETDFYNVKQKFANNLLSQL